MEYTLEEKYARIREDILAAIGRDPVHIAHEIMHRDYVNMHGPEHHFLDGAAFLAAYRNAGGERVQTSFIRTICGLPLPSLQRWARSAGRAAASAMPICPYPWERHSCGKSTVSRWRRRRSSAMIFRATGNVSVLVARSILRGIWISENGGGSLFTAKKNPKLKKTY